MQGMEWDRGGDTSVIINNLKLNKVENTLNFNLMNICICLEKLRLYIITNVS